MTPQTIAFVYAHPDDETFLSAALIRELADAGHKPVLLLATKGDAGKKNGAFGHLSNEELAAVREREMDKAAAILGLAATRYLGYPDGQSNKADEAEFIQRIVDFLQRHQPSVVVTFPEDGGNFHPDHMMISKMATAAVLSGRCPSVRKLYYVFSTSLADRGLTASVSIDTESRWPMKAEALRAHESQILAIQRYFGDLEAFPENRRYESFVLAWERGVLWPPARPERSVLDGLDKLDG
ncbi:PIG-L family deacetylase [Paenibacillus filicis]|uniref:PIG-L family deacetylase n=1 Tax=Paenibacillus gyeongsangnamensis TaxID=3388067 RepID=A0ABT4Q6R0_9BACL|nr:PIG-L family deacetylase [Paenibacillus filicis]MCZ8512481.1 PIG-L family deacetylase [Paenibacillus filicis]